MKVKNLICHVLVIVCAVVFVSCVDRNFNLDEVSTEVTLGGGTTTVPLGKLEKRSIDDLLGNVAIEGLTKDEDGNYQFSYASERETITIEGIPTSFEIPKVESSFDVLFPDLELNGMGVTISDYDDIVINYGDLSSYVTSTTEGVYTLPNIPGMVYPSFSGSYDNLFNYEDAHLHIDIPEQIDAIHKIYFRDKQSGRRGAPMHIMVNLNGLADINGGGTVRFSISQNGGRFTLLDENDNVVCDGNSYEVTHVVESGDSVIDLMLYFESITNDRPLNADHSLDIDLSMTCDVDFELQSKPGTFDVGNKPNMSFVADLEFDDAEVVINNDIDLITYGGDEGFDININNLPDEVKSINTIALKPDTELTLYTNGLEWFGDNAEAIEVVAQLPDYLVLHRIAGANYEYDASNREITTTIAELNKGVTVGLDAIDFGEEGIVPDNGAIKLHFAPMLRAHFNTDAAILVSELIPDSNNIRVTAGIDRSTIELRSVSGRIAYDYTQNLSFALSSLQNVNFELGGLGLSPVFIINIENPLTLNAGVFAEILPIVDGVVCEERALRLDDIVVKAATVSGDVITPTQTTLVLGKADRREEYSDERYTFVECDIDNLLVGTIPERVDIKLALNTNADEMITLYTAENFSVSYDYAMSLPLEVDDTLNLKYEGEMYFALADISLPAEFNVGDVALIADVTTTIPLAFTADIDLVDAEGNPALTELVVAEGANSVRGSEDGVTEATSTLRMEFKLGGDGGIDQLFDIGGIRLKLEATGVADSRVKINANQYLFAALKLELAGGVTVDLKSLLDKGIVE